MNYSRTLGWAAIILVLVTGIIHLIEGPEYLETTTYIGVLFFANTAGAVVSAYGIFRDTGWGWALGLLVAGGAFVAYVVSRLVGLPGATSLAQLPFFESLGTVSLVVEALFVALYVLRAREAA